MQEGHEPNSFSKMPNVFFKKKHKEESVFKQKPSESFSVERMLNGQPAFSHKEQSNAFEPKTLIINDFRLSLLTEKNSFLTLHTLFNILHKLVSDLKMPFIIYIPTHKGFKLFDSETTFTTVLRTYESIRKIHPNEEPIVSNEERKQHFKTFIEDSELTQSVTDDDIFVVDSFHMDALINKTSDIEYSLLIEDFAPYGKHKSNDENLAILSKLIETSKGKVLFLKSNIYLYAPSSEATPESLLPWFQLKTKDVNNDYILCNYESHMNLLRDIKKKFKTFEIRPSQKIHCVYLAHITSDNIIDLKIPETTRITHFDQVTNLSIEDIENKEIIPLIKRCFNLLSLDLKFSNNYKTANDTIKEGIAFEEKAFKSLLYFQVNIPKCFPSIDNLWLEIIKRSSSLVSLDLSLSNTNIEKKIVHSFNETSSQLKCLSFTLTEDEDEAEEIKLAKAFASCNFPLLESLTLSGLGNVNNKETSLIISNYKGGNPVGSYPLLENITLPNTFSNQIAFIRFFISHPKKLKHLRFRSHDYQEAFTPIDFITAKGIVNLEIIEFQNLLLEKTMLVNTLNTNLNINFLSMYLSQIEEKDTFTPSLAPLINLAGIDFYELSDDDNDSEVILIRILQNSPRLIFLNILEYLHSDEKYNLHPEEIEALYKQITSIDTLETLWFSDRKKYYKYHKEELHQKIEDGSLEVHLARLSSLENEPEVTLIQDGCTVDASYEEKDSSFTLTEYFFSKTGKHPHVAHYRISAYQIITINPEHCLQDEAFTLENNNSPNLITVDLSSLNQAGKLSSEHLRTVLPDDTDENNYYYGEIKLKNNSHWQALPSLSPIEKLLTYDIDATIKIGIQKSLRDHLFYVQIEANPLHKPLNFKFMIEVPIIKSSVLPECIKDSMTMLNLQRSHLKNDFSNEPLLLDPLKIYTGHDYLNEMKLQKKGACRHRAIVFAHFFKYESSRPIAINIIHNDCHSFCELYIDDNTYLTFDLGGAPSTLTLDSTRDPFKIEETTLLTKQINTSKKSIKSQLRHQLENKKILTSLKEKITVFSLPLQIKNKISAEIDSKVNKTSTSFEEALIGLKNSNSQNILLETSSEKHSFETLLQLSKNLPVDNFYIIYEPDELITPSRHIAYNSTTGEGRITQAPGGAFFDFLSKDIPNKIIIVLYDTFGVCQHSWNLKLFSTAP